MIRNKILERVQAGEKALGVSMIAPSDLLVEMVGRMGLDFVQFDGQHWPLTPERVGKLCMITDGFEITPTMRIPDGAESTILSYRDKGIRLITVPHEHASLNAALGFAALSGRPAATAAHVG